MQIKQAFKREGRGNNEEGEVKVFGGEEFEENFLLPLPFLARA